jgi:MFS family permease
MQAILITVFAASMIFSSGQFMPTYLQISLGTSASLSGMVLTPQGIGVFLTGLLTGQVIARTGRYKYQMILGSLAMVGFSSLLLRLDAGSSLLWVTVILALNGMCGGLVMPVTQVITQGAVSQAEQGVASSGRQFFLQIAMVMGLAILGLAFTSSYSAGFERHSAAFSEQLPAEAYEAFHADPTITLDEARFEPVRAQIEQQPEGAVLLERTLQAQREGVADGIVAVFTGTFIAAIAIFVICITLREITLRRSFDDVAAKPVAVEVEA